MKIVLYLHIVQHNLHQSLGPLTGTVEQSKIGVVEAKLNKLVELGSKGSPQTRLLE